jgi:hypothetical protein
MQTVIPMGLEAELAYYDLHKSQLLESHEGKYVLIGGNEFKGAFDSIENAYSAGVEAFGQKQFLVKKVTRVEPVLTNLALSHGLVNANL